MLSKYNYKLVEYGNGQKEIRHYSTPVIVNGCGNKGNSKKDKNPLALSSRSISNSMNRTKNSIYDLAKSNKWDYFITLTFDKAKVDRTDYDLLLNKVTKWLNNLRRVCPNLKYLIVPEMHNRIESNGLRAFHFHGLISNCDGLTIIPSIDKRDKQRITKSGLPRFEIKNYKLGFSDATPIHDTYRVSSYILKYVTKAECCVNKGKRRFLSSKNLCVPRETNFYADQNALFVDEIHNADYISVKEINVGEYHQKITFYHYVTNN